MRSYRNGSAVTLISVAIVLAACASPGVATGDAPPRPGTSSASTATQAPAPTAMPTTAAVAITVGDPCQVLTAAEASALAGVEFGPGSEEATGSGADTGRRCNYGAGTKNVFFVQVGEAPDAATAAAEWDAEQADVDAALKDGLPAGVSLEKNTADVNGLADKAALGTWTGSIEGQTLNGCSIALLKGRSFLAFGDVALNAPAPDPAAMQSQAKTSLERLP